MVKSERVNVSASSTKKHLKSRVYLIRLSKSSIT